MDFDVCITLGLHSMMLIIPQSHLRECPKCPVPCTQCQELLERGKVCVVTQSCTVITRSAVQGCTP